MPYTIPSYTVSPGSVYQPKGAGLILDQITGAIAAWSTRRLISTAPADIARGRDASTNEEDFTATELAGSGFTDLAGAGDGFYVTLYDQVGSNDATQATAASQPKGVDTGSLITDGGVVPAMRFDGANDGFDASNVTSVKSIFLRLKTSDIKFIIANPPLGQAYILIAEQGSSTTPINVFSGSGLNYYVNSALQSWTTRDDVYASISTGAYLSLCITNLTLSPVYYSSGISFFYNSYFSNWEMSADVTDIITFNRNLTASEISQIHTALA